MTSINFEINFSFLIKPFYLQDLKVKTKVGIFWKRKMLYMWNYSSYGEVSLPVYTFSPGWNFILGWTHPGMKKILFTCKFHLGMKWVEFHPGMKFNLKENLPWSMKTYNKIYHFFSIIEIRSLICQTISFLEKELCSSFSSANFLSKAFPDMVLRNRAN